MGNLGQGWEKIRGVAWKENYRGMDVKRPVDFFMLLLVGNNFILLGKDLRDNGGSLLEIIKVPKIQTSKSL